MPLPITYLTGGTRSSTAGATGVTPALPASRVNGNLLIAIVGSKNNETHTWPAAWNKVEQVNSGASFTVSWGWRWVDGTEAAPAVTWTGSVAAFGKVVQFSHWGPGRNPVGATRSANGTTSTHAVTAITTTGDASTVIYLDGAAANTALGAPAGWTEKWDAGSATGATRDVGGEKYVAASGSSSDNISVTGAAAAWVMWQIELLAYLPSRGLGFEPGDTSDRPALQGGGIAPSIPAGLDSERGRPGPALRAIQRFSSRALTDRPGTAPAEAAAGSYTLTASAGSATIAGASATLLKSRLIASTAGAATAAGVSATLRRGYTITASPGAITAAGVSATLTRSKLITASPGAATVAGASATLTRSRVIAATAGAATIAGVSASINRGYRIAADPGSATGSSIAATLLHNRVIVSTAGAITLSGASANVVYGVQYTITGNVGSITVAGASATITRTRLVTAGGASIVVAGASATIRRDLTLTASPGAATVAGVSATLTFTPNAGAYTITASPGLIDLSGAAANIVYVGTAPAPATFVGGVGRGRRRIWVEIRNGQAYEVSNEQEARKVVKAIKRKTDRAVRQAAKAGTDPPELPVIEVRGDVDWVAPLKREIAEISVDWAKLYERIAFDRIRQQEDDDEDAIFVLTL